jgi:hypothetical protein
MLLLLFRALHVLTSAPLHVTPGLYFGHQPDGCLKQALPCAPEASGDPPLLPTWTLSPLPLPFPYGLLYHIGQPPYLPRLAVRLFTSRRIGVFSGSLLRAFACERVRSMCASSRGYAGEELCWNVLDREPCSFRASCAGVHHLAEGPMEEGRQLQAGDLRAAGRTSTASCTHLKSECCARLRSSRGRHGMRACVALASLRLLGGGD